jgi:hypothetical protein
MDPPFLVQLLDAVCAAALVPFSIRQVTRGPYEATSIGCRAIFPGACVGGRANEELDKRDIPRPRLYQAARPCPCT